MEHVIERATFVKLLEKMDKKYGTKTAYLFELKHFVSMYDIANREHITIFHEVMYGSDTYDRTFTALYNQILKLDREGLFEERYYEFTMRIL